MLACSTSQLFPWVSPLPNRTNDMKQVDRIAIRRLSPLPYISSFTIVFGDEYQAARLYRETSTRNLPLVVNQDRKRKERKYNIRTAPGLLLKKQS